jgi:hypothetical protein
MRKRRKRKMAKEFQRDWETKEELPIHLGRLQVGDHVVRLIFTPELELKLVMPEELKEHIVWMKIPGNGLGCIAGEPILFEEGQKEEKPSE